MKDNTDELVNKLFKACNARQFKDFIEYIRFPFFKNLKVDSRIDFSFPFTVLIGINGSGKSSALQALYGAPAGYSTGHFWFSTELDPIKNEEDGRSPSFIYGYKNSNGDLIEVIKMRIGSSKGADYWEPSRPLKKYGMTPLPDGARNPVIDKKVIYLDFRSELSAFDKYFYFGNFRTSKLLKTKQDVLRKYAKHIRRTMDTKSSISSRNRKSKAPIILTESEVSSISDILGKSYLECKIINHNFYGAEGATAYFNSNNISYSEAFAGRGEYAVVQLVHEINRAPEDALIILDEPEVSLHPAAQEKLKFFLLKKCLEKKLQIVISTHSPKLVEHLPSDAIKLFYEDEAGKFNILNDCSYYEAFKQIGERIDSDNKKTIIVEDSIAKELIENILIELGGDYPILFQVRYYPGGAEDIYKSSVAYSQEKVSNKYIILDGDKKKTQYDPKQFTVEDTQNISFLETKIREVTNCDFKKLGFRIDGNHTGGDKKQKTEAILNYLTFNNNYISYFPLDTPEEIIWDEVYANTLLKADSKKMPVNITNYKEKFVKFSELFCDSSNSETINIIQKKFIKEFIKNKNQSYMDIINILQKIKK